MTDLHNGSRLIKNLPLYHGTSLASTVHLCHYWGLKEGGEHSVCAQWPLKVLLYVVPNMSIVGQRWSAMFLHVSHQSEQFPSFSPLQRASILSYKDTKTENSVGGLAPFQHKSHGGLLLFCLEQCL